MHRRSVGEEGDGKCSVRFPVRPWEDGPWREEGHAALHLGHVGSRPPAGCWLPVIAALKNKCLLGLGFLCNILAFDTWCLAVSVSSPGRISQTRVDVYSRFPVRGFGRPRCGDASKFCGFVLSGTEPA